LFESFPSENLPVSRDRPGGESAPDSCSLCGLPVGRSRLRWTLQEKAYRFCCPGCLAVFQVLYHSSSGLPGNPMDTDLARTCAALGLVPGNPAAGSQRARNDPVEPSDPLLEVHALEETFRLEGMWCPACGWLVENLLSKTAGVLGAQVSFAADLARVRYLPHVVSPQEIRSRVRSLGYGTHPVEDGEESAVSSRGIFLRLGITAILTMNVMMISFALYWGLFQDLDWDAGRAFALPLFLLATPVVLYGGWPIYQKAWAGILHGTPTMEVLIAAGSLAAYGYSVFRMREGSMHLYFDTATMLIFLVLLGKTVQSRARARALRGIRSGDVAAGNKAPLWSNGRKRWVPLGEVRPGDLLRIDVGERVPADGRVFSGKGTADESVVTGESRPRRKAPGNECMAGSVLLDGALVLRVLRTGEESTLSRISRMIQQGLLRKNGLERFADVAAARLIPVVFGISLVTGVALLWVGKTPTEAFLRSLTVLAVTCPCALGIAAPLAKVSAIGAARRNGVVILEPSVLDRPTDPDVMVFDKTGTLTEGSYSLIEVICTDGIPLEVALGRLAAIESPSDHLLAREIVNAAEKRLSVPGSPLPFPSPSSFEAHEGKGVSGTVEGIKICAGNRRLMEEAGLSAPSDFWKRGTDHEMRGETVVFFGWEGQTRGFAVLGDKIRENARAVVHRLQSRGISVRMVSGDSAETTRRAAEALGIEGFVGAALPRDKVRIIEELQARGLRVAMAGDGINDAGALARADVSIAVGVKSGIVYEASDLLLLSPDPLKILWAMELARASNRVMRRNFFFSFFYNFLAIPLAVSGALNPVIAALAMFAGSLTVTANTLRFSAAFSPKEPPGRPKEP